MWSLVVVLLLAQSEFMEDGLKKPVAQKVTLRFFGDALPAETLAELEKSELVKDLKRDEKKLTASMTYKGTYAQLLDVEKALGDRGVVTDPFRLRIKYTFTDEVVAKAGKKFFAETLLRIPGVKRVHSDFIGHVIDFYGEANPDAVVAAFAQAGFGATVESHAWYAIEDAKAAGKGKKVEEALLKLEGVLRATAAGKKVKVLALKSVTEESVKKAIADVP